MNIAIVFLCEYAALLGQGYTVVEGRFPGDYRATEIDCRKTKSDIRSSARLEKCIHYYNIRDQFRRETGPVGRWFAPCLALRLRPVSERQFNEAASNIRTLV